MAVRTGPRWRSRLARAGISLFFSVAGASLAACGEGSDLLTPVEIEVTGIDHTWYVRYPGADGALGTADDRFGQRDVLLPTESPVTLHLRSADYVYFFQLPDVGLQEAAMPEAELSLSLTTTVEAALPIELDTMCGLPYEEVEQHVRVLSRRDYRARVAALDATDAAMATAIAGVDVLEADVDFARRVPAAGSTATP